MRLLVIVPMLWAVMTPSACAPDSPQPPTSSQQGMTSTPDELRALAKTYYTWRDSVYPVGASDNGLHTWDDRLTDYRMSAVTARRQHVERLLAQVKAMRTATWSKDDQINGVLFTAQLEGAAFFPRVMRPEESDPQVYVGECSNGIFSLLKKEYASRSVRAMAAAARLRQVPAMLEIARTNLTRPVQLYAKLAIDAARGGDDLFTASMMTLADSLAPADRAALVQARDSAIAALHSFADWLRAKLSTMVAFEPMGEANYNYLLKHVYLLPIDAAQVAMLGEAELARFRGLEAQLPDPSFASPDPARSHSVPKDQDAFLAAYQSRDKEMRAFLESRHLVTIPPYIGPFLIRQLPEAFKPTSPGGFMNPPGVYDRDPSGFFFIPTYNPKSGNFYIRAAIEDPRPILGHEGVPGHFLQISIANHLQNEIRRQHNDGVFIEGWALYTEEMLLHEGLYPENSPSHGQVLRLARYRAARIGVDVNLQTGRWTFEEAVKYFMDAGGLDREAAEGEAAGAASSPSQKITYMVGKWQITRLLGKYRDQQGAAFRLGAFHDQLLSGGSLPLSVVEWMLFDDKAMLDRAMR
jgi:uncharacterized protein (DUF885 family)